jgi:hypothetical protein
VRLIFCQDPLQPRQPDSLYQAEAATVEELGIEYALINFEALVDDGDPEKAVRKVIRQDHEVLGLYRGWMLKPEQYQQLYQALLGRGVRLINDPASYQHCHYLPQSYSIIEDYTPRSIWIETGPEVSMDRIMAALQPFGEAAIIVKDFVKSQKHYWLEACYIPSASDVAVVERVVRRFLGLQGEDLNGGLVFREFVEFEPLATHSRSGMPLTKEFRLFFLDGELVYSIEYWEEGDYTGLVPPIDRFQDVARKVQSRFFTMDVAKRAAGDWLIVELGDGQVAGLPENADVRQFYEAIVTQWPPEE